MRYEDILAHARLNKQQIKLHAGFIPRTYAKMLMKEGEESGIKTAK